MTDIKLKLKGREDIIIDSDDLTVGKTKKIIVSFSKLKDKHSIFIQYPVKEVEVKEFDEDGKETGNVSTRTETQAEWQLRVSQEIVKTLEKKKGEKDADYQARFNKIATEDHISNVAAEFTVSILEIMGRAMTQSELEDIATVENLVEFCRAVLKIGRISDPTGVFFLDGEAQA